MMTLLGQHGRIQDFHRGVELVRYSADAADENAPQGAYVSVDVSVGDFRLTDLVGLRHAPGPRTSPGERS